jgi:hypothetical protein
MERWSLIIALLAVLSLALFWMRRRSPLHLFVLVVFSTALVGTFYPLLSTIVEPSSWRNVTQVKEPEFLAVQAQFLAFACGLALVALCARLFAPAEQRARDTLRPDSARARRDIAAAWILVGFGGSMYAVFIAKVGFVALLSRVDYAEKYLLSNGLGPFLMGLQVMIAGCLWAEASQLTRTQRLPFRCIALAIAVWTLAFISVRTNFVILALGYGWIHCARRGLELQRVRIVLVVGLLLAYVGLEGFSLFRGAVQEHQMGDALQSISAHAEDSVASIVGGSELSHPFLTTIEVMQQERAGDLGGESYWNALPAFLPRALNPGRPDALSERFVRTQYAELAERGGGASFSLVAEAWWNFGSLLGPFFIAVALGAMLMWVERRAYHNAAGIFAKLTPYLVYLVVIAHRSEAAILVKQSVSILIIVLVACLAAELCSTALERAFLGRRQPAGAH